MTTAPEQTTVPGRTRRIRETSMSPRGTRPGRRSRGRLRGHC